MARVSKITIGRLFNLGSYEHVRYEVTVEVDKKESAAVVMRDLEQIMENLKPVEKQGVFSEGSLHHDAAHCAELFADLRLPEAEFRRKHGHFEGSPLAYATRCQAHHEARVTQRRQAEERSAKAREQLDHLGGQGQVKESEAIFWEQLDHLGGQGQVKESEEIF